MALNHTAGFDVLVQLSEAELNAQIPLIWNVPSKFNVLGLQLLLDAPVIDFDQPPPDVGLTIAIKGNATGTIFIVHPISVFKSPQLQFVQLDFTGGPKALTVTINPIPNLPGSFTKQVESGLTAAVKTALNNKQINLSGNVAVHVDTDPLTIFDIAVTPVNDVSAANRDCLAIGLRTDSGSGGDISQVTTSFIPPGSQSVVMFSNPWLLGSVMRPKVAAELGRPVSDFDHPLRLNTSIPTPIGVGELTRLEASVEGNRIRVDGAAAHSGKGWSATADFTFYIDIGISGGAIVVTATTPAVHLHAHLEWWVKLASLALPGMFGGLANAVVAAVVMAMAKSLAQGIAEKLVATFMAGQIGTFPPVPLGPVGSMLALSSLVLDDLELRGSIVHSHTGPVRSQGSHTSSAPFMVDLETGTVTATAPATDLAWHPLVGITTRGAAALTITGQAYHALTAVQVMHLPLSGHQVPLALIPFSQPPALPNLAHAAVVCGVRTREGRYARIRAWRSPADGACTLEWATYDTPVPRLTLDGRWSVLDRGPESAYLAPDCSMCRTGPVSRWGVIDASPWLMEFPVDLQWCLCGTVLKEGEGNVPSPYGPLMYSLAGQQLGIETQMGQAVDCELCVSAVDAQGRELFTCIPLLQSGIETQCRQCVPAERQFRLEVIAAEEALGGWRPLLADAAGA